MVVDMVKNWKITNIRTEPDGSQTVFFTVSKSRVEPDGAVSTNNIASTFVVPEGITEERIEQELFKILEKSGLI
jgi:hypothetical protein